MPFIVIFLIIALFIVVACIVFCIYWYKARRAEKKRQRMIDLGDDLEEKPNNETTAIGFKDALNKESMATDRGKETD